ncbi:MAG TPA: CoA transferase subunit A [Anaerolineae bacterium]|nr:CoA transferase subunit A [Anaerolineae bacterium]
MKVLQKGKGKLIGWHDPDDARAWVAAEKSRQLIDKRLTVSEAVDRYIHEGDIIASGGFGHVRVSMAIIYEIIRQQKRNLVMAAKTAVHDCDLLVAAGCIRDLEVAYAFGHELRGLSPASRKIIEDGECKVIAEISNAGYQWRFLAGMMGVPFIPTRTMLGTDTLAQSSAIVVEDPFSGKPITLVPAIYPDVAFIHVHRCDRYGNAQIDGTMIEDFELSRCARKLILTTEEVVDDAVIREKPWMTMIPFFLVDAVVEVPYGSHPCEMPAMYDFDEDHIAEWLRVSRTQEGIASYFDEYIFGVDDFEAYLERCGGAEKLEYLKRRENLQEPKRAPWRNGR